MEKKQHTQNSSCALAMALDIFGDHWTFLIVRDLGLRGKNEYKELLNSPEGISTNILSNRLKKLAALDIIGVVPHPTHGKRKFYYLKQKGKSLLPVIIDMFIWSDQHIEEASLPEKLKQALLKYGKDKTIEIILKGLKDWESVHLST